MYASSRESYILNVTVSEYDTFCICLVGVGLLSNRYQWTTNIYNQCHALGTCLSYCLRL